MVNKRAKLGDIKLSIQNNKEDWGTIMGHLYGDGGFKCNKVYYHNTEEKLIDNFKLCFNRLFSNVNVRLNRIKESNNNIKGLRCSSSILSRYIKQYDVYTIFQENPKTKINFLKALFDDEGSVSKSGIISICNKNKKMIQLMVDLLKDLKIDKIKKYTMFNKKYSRRYYAFRLSKEENNKFKEIIGFNHPKKVKRVNKLGKLRECSPLVRAIEEKDYDLVGYLIRKKVDEVDKKYLVSEMG